MRVLAIDTALDAPADSIDDAAQTIFHLLQIIGDPPDYATALAPMGLASPRLTRCTRRAIAS